MMHYNILDYSSKRELLFDVFLSIVGQISLILSASMLYALIIYSAKIVFDWNFLGVIPEIEEKFLICIV